MKLKSPITTHVLDTSAGQPANGIEVILYCQKQDGTWIQLASKLTDSDGRIADFLTSEGITTGRYRLVFSTEAYFKSRGTAAFYPEVTIDFVVTTESENYHVPLLLSPYGYTTYRGS